MRCAIRICGTESEHLHLCRRFHQDHENLRPDFLEAWLSGSGTARRRLAPTGLH
jgi:hypothetical protein